MIILDTNVVSEAMEVNANPRVTLWLNGQPAQALYLTTVSLAELLFGIEIMAAGKRRRGLKQTLDILLQPLFGDRMLSFDEPAAVAYASIVGRAQSRGLAISTADGQIAAIAKVHDFAVATRDTAPFLAAGIRVINPWNMTA